jgi:mono/diheme cytochrome c family protein
MPAPRTLTPATLLLALAFALPGCRGGLSESPPVHLVKDMDFQPKLKAQAAAPFPGWKDGRAMRLPVPGTVARDSLPKADLAHKNPDGSFVTTNPLPLSAAVLERGRERFDIFCSVCHGYSGRGGSGAQGHGMVGRRWPSGVIIPSFHAVEGKDNRVALLKDGEIFDVLASPIGKGTMPSYAARIPVEDRWAIIHYIRALQELGKP